MSAEEWEANSFFFICCFSLALFLLQLRCVLELLLLFLLLHLTELLSFFFFLVLYVKCVLSNCYSFSSSLEYHSYISNLGTDLCLACQAFQHGYHWCKWPLCSWIQISLICFKKLSAFSKASSVSLNFIFPCLTTCFSGIHIKCSLTFWKNTLSGLELLFLYTLCTVLFFFLGNFFHLLPQIELFLFVHWSKIYRIKHIFCPWLSLNPFQIIPLVLLRS